MKNSLRLVEGFTLPSTSQKFVEDIYGSFENYAWVIDGVRSLVDPDSDETSRMVKEFNAALHQTLVEHHGKTAPLYSLVEYAHKKVNWSKYQSAPHANIAFVRVNHNSAYRGITVDYVVLGECAVVVPDGDQTFVVQDLRLMNFAQAEGHKAVTSSHRGATPEELLELLHQMDVARDHHRNVPDGYYTLSRDITNIKQAYSGTLPCSGPIIMMTPGCANLFRLRDPHFYSNVEDVKKKGFNLSVFVKDLLNKVEDQRFVRDATMIVFGVPASLIPPHAKDR